MPPRRRIRRRVHLLESELLDSTPVAIAASGGRSRNVVAPGMVLIVSDDGETDLVSPAEYAEEYTEL